MHSIQTSRNEGLARPASGAAVVRACVQRIDHAMLSELPDSEREFYCEARRNVRLREDGRKDAAKRRERDGLNIESLANAMLDMGNDDPETFRDLPIADVAAAAQVDLRQAKRLQRDAYWLARDHVVTPADVKEGETDYQRDLRIATDAMTCGSPVKTKHMKPAQKPYSPRHARIVDQHCKQEEYLRRMAEEPRAQSHIVEGHGSDGVVVTRHQSATDRFEGRGFVSEPGWVGGSSTQENGGTCRQDAYVENGKRSADSVMTQRVIAATPKAPGKRRKGISNKKVIQRIAYLEGIGKTPEEIAADEKVGETVSRVKGALHARRYDNRHWAGDNNDRRHVHRKKWVALDQIHGNTRTDCREVIRGDKDHIFESWQEFQDYINTLKVRPQKVNFVRDDEYPERVTKPHLLWILPEGRGVWYNESTGMAMLEAAAAALTIMAGCDIGGLANIGDIKQPTSPRVVSKDIETEHLPDLSELCRILNVDLKENLVVTMRSQSVAQMVAAGVSETQSGAFYALAGKRAFELCMLWERMRELRVDLDLDRRHLGEQLFEALLADRFMVDELSKLRASALAAAENSIKVAAKKVAESYGKGRRATSRGYDLRAAEAEVSEKVAEALLYAPSDMTLAQLKKLEIDTARSVGGIYCNRVQVQRSVRRIADAILEISKTAVPTEKSVRELTSMDPRTIGKHWDAAIAFHAANAIVAHVLDAPPVAPEPEIQADTIPAADPAKCSGVRGATGTDSPKEQPSQSCDEAPASSGEILTLESLVRPTVLPLVNGLRPWNQVSGSTQTGRALLEFCRPGVRLYRSKHGIREEARRLRKGRPDNITSLDDVDVWPEAVSA